MNQLIREYRERKRIDINIEMNLVKKFYIKYDNLSIIKKIEIFEHFLAETKGEDLKKIL